MQRSDAGDFELVLGNRQLLSVFFILVVLLGVVFTMGYVGGRNTTQGEVAAGPSEPLVVEAGGTPSLPPPAVAASSPAPSPPEQAEAPAAPSARPEPPAQAASSGPAAGQVFLQVAATGLSEAEVLLNVLDRRGFTGRLAPVPDQDLYRVLVGPIDGVEDLAETRSGLQAAGFQPFTRRY